MKCICGREFESRRGLAGHLSRSHTDIDEVNRERIIVDELYGSEVVDAAISKYTSGQVCADELYRTTDIVKLLSLIGVKRTNSEEKRTDRYKNKYLATIVERYGVTSVSKLDWIKQKKADTAAMTFGGSYDEYLAHNRNEMAKGYKEWLRDEPAHRLAQAKQRQTCLNKYGHTNFGAGAAARAKSLATRRHRAAQWDYEERLARTSVARAAVCHRGGGLSKPEAAVRAALTSLGITYRTNVHMWHYNYDMVFDNHIIEVQGDMWHANPQKYKATDLIMGKLLASDLWEKDARKKQKAELEGYTLMCVWECDIVSRSADELAAFVEQLLKENGYVVR